ncbi:hypothetical protein NLJ89_g4200 [Agrocybe chaxingu]|uniref:Dolichyl-diphosphooligosaccharide--protein glycosyltransferase subunit WBP1 n=1 Tax=Agrocybe chaxingu TaxID=84603 RepID=A0A9W8K4F3_9AGAR|nr:hypothetical protein NLJ89_g4200 [Agrocybe chaxingu]
MFGLRRLLLLAVGLASFVDAKSWTGNTVLVVVEPRRQDDFSIFFEGLKDQGYQLTFRAPMDEKPAVIEYDEPSFAHVIILASETKNFAKDITPQSLINLANLGTNLLLGLSTKQTPLASLAPDSLVPIKPTKRDATNILSKDLAPVWFSGIPQALGNNPLLVPILHAPAESFASEIDGGSADALLEASQKGGEGLWAGSRMSVVTGFQTTDGSRVTWLGGVDILSDELALKTISKGVKSGNIQFGRDIAAWTFQESNVLRIEKVEHHRVNDTEPLEQYTTNDQLAYNIYISKFNPVKDIWEPYSGLKDLQLEFTMLDPHIRIALPPVSGVPGKYSVSFRAPDRHGVFKFVVDYKRTGWTYLHSSTTVPVVPPRHDGYPRFLSAAWPYYAGAISTSVGFFLFSAIWLAGEVRESSKRPGKAGKSD